MPVNRVLVVEDDQTLLDVLKYNLVKEGYLVTTATDGAQALEVARSERPDVIILDIMLPELDGLEVCRILRREMTVPILMLTAKSEEVDKVVGLEIGADDYMTKPFSMRELLARVRSMLRRADMVRKESSIIAKSGAIVTVGDLEIETDRHRVSRSGETVELAPKEFDLLAFLATNPGRVFSRDYLLERVWGYDYAGGTRTVDVHMRWLRKKLESDPASPRHLITVRGVGYKFEG
jgi:two-component system OmpR family response regulator